MKSQGVQGNPVDFPPGNRTNLRPQAVSPLLTGPSFHVMFVALVAPGFPHKESPASVLCIEDRGRRGRQRLDL